MKREQKFLLLQINDALFPIGGYSHSYGLETYIQKELVSNAQEAEEYIKKKLSQSFLYQELFFARLAWEAAKKEDLSALKELEEILEAGKTPSELREASKKAGSRFVKTLKQTEISYETSVFEGYISSRKESAIHHVIAYGVFCAATGMEKEECLEHFLYAQTSAMVTNCVKTIPLSQTTGQQLLVSCYAQMSQVLDEVQRLPIELLGAGAPGFDIRCMQHEGLYSRIYMS